MKAIQYHEFGAPDVLRLHEIDKPVPNPGEALIRVTATSFNPIDAALRAGLLPHIPFQLPHVPGLDVAGTTEDGRAVIGFLPATHDGAGAEWATAPVDVLTAAPKRIPLADAAVLPLGALTAWQGLVEHAGLRPGQRILINGAGGGVGGYAVQFARDIGAHVIATASPRSAATVEEQGADQLVDYTVDPVTKAVTEPVDVVFNLASANDATMAALVALVRPGGVVVSTASPAPEDNARQVRTVGMYVRRDAEQLRHIVHRIDAGTLRPDISARYELADLSTVHALAAAGKLRGKVVVSIPA